MKSNLPSHRLPLKYIPLGIYILGSLSSLILVLYLQMQKLKQASILKLNSTYFSKQNSIFLVLISIFCYKK